MGGVFHGALKLLVVGMGVGGHVQAGWSTHRDAILNWRFSKETLFQFCCFMVGTSLWLNLEVLVAVLWLSCYVTWTRSINLSEPQCTHLQMETTAPVQPYPTMMLQKPFEDKIAPMKVLWRTGHTMCKWYINDDTVHYSPAFVLPGSTSWWVRVEAQGLDCLDWNPASASC